MYGNIMWMTAICAGTNEDRDRFLMCGDGMGMEAICAGMDGVGDRV